VTRIRQLTTKDRPQYRELCRYCFGMSAEHASMYVAHKKEYDQAFGAFEGRKLAAGLWYYPYKMRVGEKYLPMAGVSAVATWPEYRHHGLARKLMTRAQEYMKKTGCPISVLLPFKFSFYERLGYGHAFDVLICEFDPRRLRRFPMEGYRVEEVDGPRRCREFEEVHRRFGEGRNGTVQRDLAYWKRHYFTSHKYVIRSYLVYRGKAPCGLVITGVEEPRDLLKAKVVVVQLAWTEPGAARAVFTFFKNHSDQFEKVRVFVPPDLNVLQYFEDPRVEVKLQPKMMFKLVDAAPAIEGRSYPAGSSSEVVIQLQGDETAPWNTGHYLVSFAGKKAQVRQLKARHPVKSSVMISIKALSQLYLGYYCVDELRQMNAITGPEEALAVLAHAFPKTPVYIDDWF